MNDRDPSQPDSSNADEVAACHARFEAAGDAIFLLECVRFVACNPSTLTLYGCKREEILGKTPWDFPSPQQPDGSDSEAGARTRIEWAFAGEPQLFEWQHRRLDGSLFEAEIRLNRVDQPRGPLLQAIVRDITARKRAEEGLRLYRHIVADSSDHISVLDRDYVYRLVNKTYVSTHGRSTEEIVGHSVADLFGREVFEGLIKENLDRCFAGEVVHYQAWFELKALGRRYMNVTYTPHWDHAGSVSGAIVSSRDMTELHLAEGVETEAQLAFLQIHGCDAYQGYLCSRPVPASILEQWLAQQAQAADKA